MNAPPPSKKHLDLAGAHMVVVGAGASGLALTRFLLSRRAAVTLSDSRPAAAFGTEVEDLGRRGAVLELGGHDEQSFLRADLIIVSPGVPLSAAPIVTARRGGVHVVAEIEFASWFLHGNLIGITGTNGKSTTTALTAHLLSRSGLEATACGNLGPPLTDFIERDSGDHYHVIELSSFQLEGIDTFRPRIAALLNLSPDHQDRYPSPEAYYQAKCRIFMNQEPSDHALINRDDPEVRRLESTVAARLHPFTRSDDVADGACVKGGEIVIRRKGLDIPVIPVEALPLHGAHNIDNALAAMLIADLVGAPTPRAAQALRTFLGLPHRLEKIRDLDGVSYFNDSKATNVGATLRSVQSFESQVVLILGGRDKGGRFEDLRPLISQRVSHLIIMGEARDAIEAQIGPLVPIHRVGTMTAAVAAARTVASAGSVVLLAPACASFDQYSGFAERGEDFRRKVLALPDDASRAPAIGPRES